MNAAAVLRGGALAGVLVAVIVTVAGTLLDLSVPPWSWSAATPGLPGRSADWAREFGTLLPFCIAHGVLIAFGCALIFEFVVARASATAGAIVGLAAGTLTATVLGLIPWIAFWFAYAYMTPTAPLGPYNASWLWLAVTAASAMAGAVAGGTYGPVCHRSRWPRGYPSRETYTATPRMPL